jgi:hypothetical protein
MDKKKKRNTIDYVLIGILLFILIVAAVIVTVKVVRKIRYNSQYGDILDLAEKNGLNIISIDHSEASGAEIYISERAVSSATMEKYCNFGQELSVYLDGHGDVFDPDTSPVTVLLTFGGTDNQSATHFAAAVCRPSAGESKYGFTEYYCRFETDFEGISYLKNAKRLYLLRGEITDLKGIENFAGLEYLCADIAEDKRSELRKKLPLCEIEFKNSGNNE